MSIGILTLEIHLPGCRSLKEKRRRLKPLLARLHKEFNISASELDHQDSWQSTRLGCAMIANDAGRLQSRLTAVVSWIERRWPDVTIMDDKIEVLN